MVQLVTSVLVMLWRRVRPWVVSLQHRADIMLLASPLFTLDDTSIDILSSVDSTKVADIFFAQCGRQPGQDPETTMPSLQPMLLSSSPNDPVGGFLGSNSTLTALGRKRVLMVRCSLSKSSIRDGFPSLSAALASSLRSFEALQPACTNKKMRPESSIVVADPETVNCGRITSKPKIELTLPRPGPQPVISNLRSNTQRKTCLPATGDSDGFWDVAVNSNLTKIETLESAKTSCPRESPPLSSSLKPPKSRVTRSRSLSFREPRREPESPCLSSNRAVYGPPPTYLKYVPPHRRREGVLVYTTPSPGAKGIYETGWIKALSDCRTTSGAGAESKSDDDEYSDGSRSEASGEDVAKLNATEGRRRRAGSWSA
ncbi:hypothetical protein BJ138DRAFT_1178616 [Hygrophoropsis aurantiaca]|uniref:Uncharacterized protein n=1 Tax=Hygrophoropsis aurantiaca TaxID=72124 RepID=A0ACB8AHR1_9AGAM|nr:hypothetical protein BJ138DRAFT_1178616 [Hygrophoropsis aurantiaca]